MRRFRWFLFATLATSNAAADPRGLVQLEGGALVSPASSARRDAAPLAVVTATLALPLSPRTALGIGLSSIPYPHLFQLGVPVRLELVASGRRESGLIVRLGARGLFVPVGVCVIGGRSACEPAPEGARTAGWGLGAALEAGLGVRFPVSAGFDDVGALELAFGALGGPLATFAGGYDRPLAGLYLGGLVSVGGMF